MEFKKMKMEKFDGKLRIIKGIAVQSTKAILEDSKAYTLAGGVGLYQGLKYNGNMARGMKAGLATMGVLIGSNIVQNIVHNLEEIKKA